MIWLASAVAAYSFYTLFTSQNGRDLALSLVRAAVAMILMMAVHTQSEMIISAAVAMNVAVALVAMVILRKEVQLKNDEL